jgi:hypothetical protein
MEDIDNYYTIDDKLIINTSTQKEDSINLFPEKNCTFNKDGEIIFTIDNTNYYLLPSKSYLHIEGVLRKSDDSKLKKEIKNAAGEITQDADPITLTNNAPLYLFNSATYSINGKTVEHIDNPGRATLIKGLLSYSSNLSRQNTFGWIMDSKTEDSFNYKMLKYTQLRDGNISFCIPLSHIFGFAECYKKIIYGVKHTLSLYRKPEKDSIHSKDLTMDSKFSINNISWKIPKIQPSLEMENKFMKMFDNKTVFQLP